MSLVWKSLFGWNGGLRNARTNPLNAREDSLIAGQNVDLSDGTIRTRPGCSVMSDGSLPVGEVRSLKQVRFPTNETAYLVCQCYQPGEDDSGITENQRRVVYHGSVVNETTGEIYVTWGDQYSGGIGLCHYRVDPDTQVWSTSEYLEADPVEEWPSASTYPYNLCGAVQVWAPELGVWVSHGGYLSGGGDSNAVWGWDPLTGKLIILSPEDLTSLEDGFRAWHTGFWYNEELWFSGGVKFMGGSYPSVFYSVLDFSRYNPVTKVWTATTFSLGGSVPDGLTTESLEILRSSTVLYNGKAYITGGQASGAGGALSNGVLICDLETETATYGEIINDTGIVGHRVIMVGDQMVFSGGYCGTKNDTGLFSDQWLKGAVGETPSPLAVTGLGNDPAKSFHGMALSGNNIVITGGMVPDDFANPIVFTPEACWFIDSSTWTVIPFDPNVFVGGTDLYASTDHLPTTYGTFSSIYSFEDQPGVCTYAVLNDRCVITEGVADVPLDWGGAMAADGSDWMYPKAVLVTQDGTNFYDISSQVCDSDVDNYAEIGSIQADGFIAVCCDVPLVDGFFWEMETVNAITTDFSGTSYTTVESLADTDNFTQINLRGTITQWVQDSGATGHFANSGGTPVTLGPGNTAPYVEPGTVVNYSGGTRVILSITDDGEDTGEVTLSDTLTSQAVSSIVGLVVDDTELTLQQGHSADTSVFAVSADQSVRYGSYSIRQIISASAISASGNSVRLTIKVGAGFTVSTGTWSIKWNGSYWDGSGYSQRPYYTTPSGSVFLTGAAPVMIRSVSIVERDGETENGTGVPTQITFPSSYMTCGNLYHNGIMSGPICSVTPGEELLSNPIAFDLDETKDYIVTMDVMGSWYQGPKYYGIAGYSNITEDGQLVNPYYGWINPPRQRGGVLNMSAGSGFYYSFSETEDTVTYNQQTVTGFTLEEGYCLGVTKIETQVPYTIAANLYVAHTNSVTQFDLSVVEDFQKVQVTQNAPGDTAIYHAVSFDGRATFKVFLGDGADPEVFAWKTIVKEEGGVWKFLADDTPTWTAASTDSLLVALQEAFAVTTNQMFGADLDAITPAQWKETGAIKVHITSTLDFAIAMQADATHVPTFTQYLIGYNDAGATTIQGWQNGAWTGGSGWTDNTILSYVPLGQDGTVTYDGTTAFEADYSTLDEVPGYWFRFKTNGTSPSTTVTRIRYRGPCQPLANIGDGQADTVLGCIWDDTSADTQHDYSVEVSDNTETSTSSGLIPLATADYLYIGYVSPFGQIEVTPLDDGNAVSSVLSAEYWNGRSWVAITITDGTIGTATGKTLSSKGKISWTTPTDWKMRLAFEDLSFPRGYWIRFKVSAGLTSTTALGEVQVYATPLPLAKHKIAATFKDRIALCDRPDAHDQVDISRAMEEYGFTGDDSASYRVGGMDGIRSAIGAWDSLMVGKNETWHQIGGSTPTSFTVQGVEAARAVPINTQVVLKAPVDISTDGTRFGLFFINAYGAYCSTGLQVDNTYASSRGQDIGTTVNWWDGKSLPRLDPENLHLACGEYYPPKKWLVWTVPMIVADGQTSQTTCNRLIVFDLANGCWLPPMTITAASLAIAYHYSAGGVGKLGSVGLYGGGYEGRVIRIFDPAATTDTSTPISCIATTPQLHFGSPQTEKELREIMLYSAGSATLTINVYVDGGTTALETWTISAEDLTSTGSPASFQAHNVCGRFMKFVLSWTGDLTIYGLQVALGGVPEEPNA